jgi:maltose alpha-D-glucosyltransferase/alpha-amylase
MHWSSDKNAGFSKASPQALVFPVIVDPEYHYESSNVEAQQRNANSLLWWNKRVLALRKRWTPLTDGNFEIIHPHNRKVLAFLRQSAEETILIVANLSRFAQSVELNLSRFRDCIPVELFGQAQFPEITENPFVMTLSPYACFWFLITPKALDRSIDLAKLPHIKFRAEWTEILTAQWQRLVERRLPEFLQQQAWFLGRGRRISSARIRDYLRISEDTILCLVNIDYNEADAEDYLLPLSYAPPGNAREIREKFPHLAFAYCDDGLEGDVGLIFDSAAHPALWQKLLEVLFSGRAVQSNARQFSGVLRPGLQAQESGELELGNVRANQHNNSSAAVGRFFVKMIRRVEPGVHPESEAAEFLATKGFTNSPAFVGSLKLHAGDGQDYTSAIVTEWVPHARTGWDITLDSLGRFFDRILEHDEPPPPELRPNFLHPEMQPLTPAAGAVLGTYVETVRLLGERTAELHLMLGKDVDNVEFAPEPYVPFSQRSLYQSLRNLVLRTLQQLGTKLDSLAEETLSSAHRLLESEKTIISALKRLYQGPLDAVRIRIHGNLHLGQVLHTGKDFLFIDFEGEPHKPFGERRIKRSPLRDVAGMLRSFHHASHAAVVTEINKRDVLREQARQLEDWSLFWRDWIATVYFQAYRARLAGTALIPSGDAPLQGLLVALLLENAFTELGIALTHGTGRERVAIEGILEILERSAQQEAVGK